MSRGGGMIRGGTRGGQDQFSWDDVKVDKDRENYLGHSVKASVGRWQKGKDLTWYTKKSKVSGHNEQVKAEVAALKKAEEEAMAAALGLKPPPAVKPQQPLTKQEITEVCRRRSMDEMDTTEEQIKGIGYQSQRAQAMFAGTKATTTKDGATIFEHDSGIKDDGRLKMPESKRRSQSDVLSPTTPIPGPAEQIPLPKNEPLPPGHPEATKKMRKKEKKKKTKKHKERRKRKDSSERSLSSSESDVWVEEAAAKKHKKKQKRVTRSSSEERWYEKQHQKTKSKSVKRTRQSPDSRTHLSKRSKYNSSSSDSDSKNERESRRSKKKQGNYRSRDFMHHKSDRERH